MIVVSTVLGVLLIIFIVAFVISFRWGLRHISQAYLKKKSNVTYGNTL